MFDFVRKWLVYRVRESVDPLFEKRVKEVCNAGDQHKAELEDLWCLMTSPDECASLMIAFLDELRLEWPREFSQLNPEKLPHAINEGLKSDIKQAYAAGYMRGKGWVSPEHETDFGLYLGDKLADNVRLVFRGVKSKGIAFACGYTAVSARGHLKALQKASG